MVPRTIPAGLVATADVSVVFGTQGEALPRAASRVREALTGAKATIPRPQIQNDPEGGIPSGSLEVTWRLEDWAARRLALVIVGVTAKFFRLMLRIVSIVSRALTISQNRTPLLRRQITRN